MDFGIGVHKIESFTRWFAFYIGEQYLKDVRLVVHAGRREYDEFIEATGHPNLAGGHSVKVMNRYAESLGSKEESFLVELYYNPLREFMVFPIPMRDAWPEEVEDLWLRWNN